LSEKALIRYLDENLRKKAGEKNSHTSGVFLYNLDGSTPSEFSGVRVMAKAFNGRRKATDKAIKLNKVLPVP